VRVAARNLANERNAAKATSGHALIQHCGTFIGRWTKANDQARAELAQWLGEEANSGVLNVLQTIAKPTQETA
jgi:hypothetical protein